MRNVRYYVVKAHRGREQQRARNYELLIEYLRSHPCVDRGETDIRVLQFDHLDPSQKTGNVSYYVLRGGTWLRALREIEKCVVRCGNCHRRKTILELRARRGHGGSIQEERGSWRGIVCEIIHPRAVSSVDRAPSF